MVPGVVYLPHLCHWWETLADAVRATFLTLLSDLEPQTPVLCLATADVPFDCLPQQVWPALVVWEILGKTGEWGGQATGYGRLCVARDVGESQCEVRRKCVGKGGWEAQAQLTRKSFIPLTEFYEIYVH